MFFGPDKETIAKAGVAAAKAESERRERVRQILLQAMGHDDPNLVTSILLASSQVPTIRAAGAAAGGFLKTIMDQVADRLEGKAS